ncbi:MAG: transporter substrate-binding domain-containing protein [Oscillospiraceae bacterium]|jgi:polar amino acid transport system substrate-binding protein/glutamine transport system substrate-binding protein|nr:transporter substrate-binding domain-containing protein [Oscillospiraceae bacterium]
MKKSRKTTKILSLVLALALALVTLTACAEKAPASSSDPAPSSAGSAAKPLDGVTLNIGTSGLFGPFSYYADDGKTLIGYDIDLFAALQEKLGFSISGDGIQAMTYSALTTSVGQGKLDLAAAALCVTDERKEVMDFSDTYCDSGLTVMINKTATSGITGVDSLAGKKVAVEKGTASHAYADKYLQDAIVEVHDAITTAYAALEQNKVDAVIQDGPGCAFYIKTNPNTNAEIVGEEFNQGQSPYAVAFKKNFEYADQFKTALAELLADGTLDELYDKWCK